MAEPRRILLVGDDRKSRVRVAALVRREWPAAALTEVGRLDGVGPALAGGPPEIVLTDYHLAGGTGLDVFRLVQAIHPDVPVIVVTASGDEAIAVEAMRAGVDDYVIDREQLLSRLPHAIEAALARRDRRRREALAARDLEGRERVLRHVLDSIAGIVLVVNVPQRQIVFINGSVTSQLGYTPEEIVSRGPAFQSALVHHDDARRIVDEIFPAIEVLADGATVTFEYRTRTKSGAWRWYRGEIAVFSRGADGRVEDAVVLAYDTTDIRASNERVQLQLAERRRLEEQLRQSQKMEVVGRLAGGVAHDFNNLLTAILGYTGMLLEEMPADDPHRDDLLEIWRAGDRASALTRQLLAFSRRQVLHPERVDLNETVTNMKWLARRVIRENISLVTEVAAEPVWVDADPRQLEEALLNLIVNASDAMPAGGTLRIETQLTRVDQAFVASHYGAQTGIFSQLTVSDTGEGMSPEVLDHIFEPFYTTKPEGRGTGLGLALVYGIVEQSQGRVWVDSVPGEGTTFTIHLPVAVPTCGSARPPEEVRPSSKHRGTESVLVVDDDEAVRALVERVLRQSGYEVLTADSAAQAKALCRDERHKVDLLLTDMVMPVEGGETLARELAGNGRDMKVVFMSGYADQKPGLAPNGALPVLLVKPFAPETLTATVRQVLDQGKPEEDS